MAFSEAYQKQVALLMRVLPFIAQEDCFALKGGTAINFFIRNMPRLSVDIDLTYLPVAPRPESLAAIDAALKRIEDRIKGRIPGCHISEGKTEGTVTKISVRTQVQTKIEVTPVIRGCVYDAEKRAVSAAVEDAFGFAEIQVVSFADLYGGKIVAALDLLANEGISDDLRRAFVVYLLSHNRPMGEVLGSGQKDISAEYERGFRGMTAQDVPLADLLAARDALVARVIGGMPEAHRRFLVSFERGEPDWDLLGVPGAADLPAVRYRQLNLDKIGKKKRAALVGELEAVLSKGGVR